jgi:hypothetical protein
MEYSYRFYSKVSRLWTSGALVFSVLFLVSAPARATRCGGGIVAVGDTEYEVLSKCGAPTFTDERQVERVKRTGAAGLVRWTVRIAEWTYDFGPNRFIGIFTFEDGRLASMRDGIYGRGTPEDGPVYVHENRVVQPGDTKYEVIIKLGRPVFSETREVEKTERTKTGDMIIHTIVFDEWTYDFGPHRFIRQVVFENGRVARVEHGGYGNK